MKPLSYYLKKPRSLGLAILCKFAKYISNDRIYLKMRYYLELGKKLDLDNPKTFNEKLNWLKLYNRKPEYMMMVDKFAVKKYVADKVGEKYIIPTLGVWNSPSEIDFDSLPNQFVLKTTHGGGGGGVVICHDKNTFNKEEAIAKLNQAMKADIYTGYREWPYKNVPRKIIAESYMVDVSGKELKDYKFFCFNGEVKFCKVDFNRFVEHHANYYSPSLSLLPFGEIVCSPDFNKQVDCPPNFDKMLEVAQQFAQGIPFARIDLYNIKGRTFFGEITFYPAGGMGPLIPLEADEKIGRLLKIPNQGGYIIDFKNYILYIHPDFEYVNDLIDYKFFCFNGVPKLCQVITDRRTDEKIDFYDMDWNRIVGLVGLNSAVHNSKYDLPCPKTYNQMKTIASNLSKNIPFSRIDLYEINGRCYFGEITFYPAGAMGFFTPHVWNKEIGEWIDLKNIDK